MRVLALLFLVRRVGSVVVRVLRVVEFLERFPAKPVVHLDFDDVGEEVTAREGEVLDDEVEGFVRILDTWDRDVSDLRESIYE